MLPEPIVQTASSVDQRPVSSGMAPLSPIADIDSQIQSQDLPVGEPFTQTFRLIENVRRFDQINGDVPGTQPLLAWSDSVRVIFKVPRDCKDNFRAFPADLLRRSKPHVMLVQRLWRLEELFALFCRSLWFCEWIVLTGISTNPSTAVWRRSLHRMNFSII
jgi:hypothetical protein